MSEREHKILKSSFASAGATLLSRLLGLGRVMLEARVLGGGAAASVWQYAFMVPNLFRRLFGEGALASALVPLILKIEAEHGTEKARKDLGVVFLALTGVLALLIVLTALAVLALQHFCRFSDYVTGALALVPMLLPYAIFMCLVGVGGALLNTRGVFFLVSAGAIIINVLMVALLGFCFFGGHTPDIHTLFREMILVVLGSGLLNLTLIVVLMLRRGIFPIFSIASWRRNPILKNLWNKVLPGFVGYSALQISVITDSTLALWVGAMAVPALNYSNRIIDLPIGIYALSIGAVLLAQMSRSAAAGKLDEIASDLTFSLRNVFFIGVPSAIFLMFCGKDVIQVLYSGGKFGGNNVDATFDALFFYAMGLPFFCALKVVTPAFFSRGDMKTPMYASLTAIVCNIGLNLILMFPLKQGGLALATVLSSLINNAILLTVLDRSVFPLRKKELVLAFCRCSAAALVAAFAVTAAAKSGLSAPFGRLLKLGFDCVIFGAVYCAASALYPKELKDCLQLLRRRKVR